MRNRSRTACNIALAAVVCTVAARITYTPACGSGRGGGSFHLDPSLQAAAEKAVGKRSACVIAMDPRTGRMLALVNEDMACRQAFPPGSILKLLTAFAGLEEGVLTPETSLECRNFYKSGGQTLICSRPGGHGKVRLADAIALSCNCYFYMTGERVGADGLLRCLRGFGLGKAMGDLPGRQSAGSVPKNLSTRADIARAAIGQAKGLEVTPLQMAVITCAIANGGMEYAPSTGKHAVLRKMSARPGTFQALRYGMRMAVVKGTAAQAAVSGLSVCGKTGSPEVAGSPEYRHAWFMGFAPYDRPRIAVVVFVKWGHGGSDAAPIAAKVFRAWGGRCE